MSIPHYFPSLIDGPAQTIVIAGTGLSAKVAPTVEELKPKLEKVAADLGILLIGADFYVLAETVLSKLEADGRSPALSRLYLAESLGMLDDRRWFGETGVPLSGNTPRHRALARFAVEKRLRAIVSLNWDALLEAALDSIGLGENTRSGLPWDVVQYARVVDDIDLPALASGRVFPIIKPHGCVREIERARQEVRAKRPCPSLILRVGAAELADLPGGQNLIDKTVEGYVSQCPLLAIGWKASEGYLRKTIIDAAKVVHPRGSDAFTLISRSWYHDTIAQAYGSKESDSFFAVENAGQPTVDCVLQWLQALYALSKLEGAAVNRNKRAIRKLREQLEISCTDQSIMKWADTWLPLWVRACWRAGVVQGVDPLTVERIPPWRIPITPRDAHVPLGGMTVQRHDLEAAAKLLIAIKDNLDRFDFDTFPGGLWDPKRKVLYLPLPGLRRTSNPSALSALKPMIDAWRWPLTTINLVWLDHLDTRPEDADLVRLEAQVRMLMPLTALAASKQLSWVELDTLNGA